MYCTKCGTKLPDGAQFCPKCGTVQKQQYSKGSNEEQAHKELEVVVSAAQRGNRSAMEELIRRSQSVVYYNCLKLLGNETTAQDATQEVFIAVFQKLNTLKNPKAYIAWVQRIALNKCKDRLATTDPLIFVDEYYEDSDNDSELLVSDDNAAPDKALDNDETRHMIRELIDQLPAEQRICVLMFYYDGMFVREIAGVLGVSENTIKSRLNYARNKLKAGIEGYERDGIKLYSTAPMAVLSCLRHFLRQDAESSVSGQIAQRIIQTVLPTVEVSSSAAGRVTQSAMHVSEKNGKAVKGVSRAAVANQGTKAAAGTAAKTAGGRITGKIIAAVLAVAVIGGGGVLLYNSGILNRPSEPETSTIAEQPEETIESIEDQENVDLDEPTDVEQTISPEDDDLTVPDTVIPDEALNAQVGDHIFFGSYEQDNDTSNGAEPIEWRVLTKEDDRILVVSEYSLDAQPYNVELADVTWETCTLRSWLNSYFLDTAFSSEEQEAIPLVTLSNEGTYSMDGYIMLEGTDWTQFTDGGNDTRDKIFLLSIYEANSYFSFPEDTMCKPTEYAIAQGAMTFEYSDEQSDWAEESWDGNCWWWLRSPSSGYISVAVVCSDGFMDGHGTVDSNYETVRPALWISTSAENSAIETAPTPTPQIESVDISTLPDSLTEFLYQFQAFYNARVGTLEFNYQTATDDGSNILAEILGSLDASCVMYYQYPVEMPTEYMDNAYDDFFEGASWPYYSWYDVFDGVSVDWIAKNIFNLTEDDISSLSQQGQDEKMFFVEEMEGGDYRYIVPKEGIGDPFRTAIITAAESDGENYYVTYDIYGVTDYTDESTYEYRDTYYAVMELKEIDGNKFWSMYSNSAGGFQM